MPKSSTTFTVVIASPGDMAADRDAVNIAIDEVNDLLRERSVQFECRRWERHVVPVATTNAQGAINEQLLNSFDVLIALFGSRLGSPTAAAQSGTVEEIEIALKNAKAHLGGLDLQVYFKKVQVGIWETDIDEVKRLVEFRREIHKKCLVKEYEGLDELGRFVRQGLVKVIDRWEEKSAASSMEVIAASHETSVETPDDELGLLELQSQFENGLDEGANALNSASEILSALNKAIEGHVERVSEAATKNTRMTEKIKIINDVALDIDQGSRGIRQCATAAKESFDRALDSMSAAVDMPEAQMLDSSMESANARKVLREQMDGLLGQSRGAKESFVAFSKTVQSLPRLTTALTRSKRGLLEATDHLLSLLESVETRSQLILSKLDQD